MAEIINIFMLGLFYGFTACSFSCMPYLAPYVLGSGSSFRDGMSGSLTFISGKIVTYSLLSGAAAYLGKEAIRLNMHAVSVLSGALLVIIGLSLFGKIKNSSCCNTKNNHEKIKAKSEKGIFYLGLGIVTSLVPCLPLSALFITSAKSGSVSIGMVYGFIYGSGLLISPIILAGGFFGFLSGRIKKELPEMKKFLVISSAVILIFMGVTEFIKLFYSGF